MNKNFKLIIEYDGTVYHGWQRQKNEPTIQAEIEKALATMTERQITVKGASRTDAGVHARGQAAHFICDTRLDGPTFKLGINALTPGGIVIKSCQEVDLNFHAQFDAKSKLYQYRILNRPTPAAIGRQYVWYHHKPLNTDAMQNAIGHITGTHDFKAFEGAGSPRKHTVRTVFQASLEKKADGLLLFEIEGDGFLRYMVRNIVGTLVAVGLQRISSCAVKDILLARDRTKACVNAPPRGLFLMQVNY
jgi:tRNA pseudouridine38-40 synthase